MKYVWIGLIVLVQMSAFVLMPVAIGLQFEVPFSIEIFLYDLTLVALIVFINFLPEKYDVPRYEKTGERLYCGLYITLDVLALIIYWRHWDIISPLFEK